MSGDAVLDALGCGNHPSGVPLSRPSALKLGCDSSGQRLAVVSTTKRIGDADRAMAWGLASTGDRELTVAVPRLAGDGDPLRLADGVRSRAWALCCQLRVAVYDEAGTVEYIPTYPKAKRDARLREPDAGSPRSTLRMTVPEWADAAELVAAVDAWATGRGVVAAHRQSYGAWHADGRRVVQLAGRPGRWRLSTGVHASARPDRFAAAKAVGDPALPLLDQWAELRDRAELAAFERIAGADNEDPESRLQARLAKLWGLSTDRREVPARRPGESDARIDLVRVHGETIELIETKIGFDDQLLLQGLDYLAWAEANLDTLAAFYNLAGQARLRLRLIVGDPTTSPKLLARWASQAQHIAPGLHVTWQTATGWQAGEGDLKLDELPLGPPSAPTWRTRQITRMKAATP